MEGRKKTRRTKKIKSIRSHIVNGLQVLKVKVGIIEEVVLDLMNAEADILIVTEMKGRQKTKITIVLIKSDEVAAIISWKSIKLDLVETPMIGIGIGITITIKTKVL